MAAHSPRSFPLKRESSPDAKAEKSRVTASEGTSGSTSPKLAAEIENWLAHLGAERRYSPKTLEAYRRDVEQFLDFLTEHLGGRPSLKDLTALTPADVRAFLAKRRAEGIGSRSLMRTLAGLRGFARYLERNGKGRVAALAFLRYQRAMLGETAAIETPSHPQMLSAMRSMLAKRLLEKRQVLLQ